MKKIVNADNINFSTVESEKKNNVKIDYIKAISIISVIMLHTIPKNILEISLARFHIWNAVPVFIILMSFTTYISFTNKNNLNELYNIKYFKRRFERIILPVLVIFIFEIIIGLLLKKDIYIGIKSLILYLPITGPGNYYITLLLQYIILAPLLFYCYKKRPFKSIIYALIINVIGEIIINIIFKDNYLYSANIVRYVFLILLGFLLYDLLINKQYKEIKNAKKVMIVGFVISFIYLIIDIFWQIPIFNKVWSKQLFLANFYPIGIVFLIMKYMKVYEIKSIAYIGKASYHIFLVQMIYFIYNPIGKILNLYQLNNVTKGIVLLIINLITCILLGILFYKIEEKWRKINNEYFSSNTSKRWFKRNT